MNRLREGNHTKQEIQKLKQRIISVTNHEYPKEAPHVFIQNAKLTDFNARAHNALPGIKYSIKAHDSVIGADSQQLRNKILSEIPNDPRKTKQLHSVLQLAVGERTEISLNTRTDNGMTNGAGNASDQRRALQVHITTSKFTFNYTYGKSPSSAIQKTVCSFTIFSHDNMEIP